VFVTLTLMQGKLVMVCVCRPLLYSILYRPEKESTNFFSVLTSSDNSIWLCSLWVSTTIVFFNTLYCLCVNCVQLCRCVQNFFNKSINMDCKEKDSCAMNAQENVSFFIVYMFWNKVYVLFYMFVIVFCMFEVI